MEYKSTCVETVLKLLKQNNLKLRVSPNSVFEALATDSSDEHVYSICNNIAIQINNEVTVFKSKLVPFLKNIQTMLEERVMTSTMLRKKPPYDIKQVAYPRMMENLETKQVLLPHRKPEPLTGQIMIKPPENIEEYFVNSDNTLSDAYEEVLSLFQGEKKIQLWNDYLVDISERNPNIKMLGVDIRMNLPTLLVLYVVLFNLLDKKPDTATVDDNKYREALTNYFNEVCNYLSIAKYSYETDRKLEVLVVGKTQYTLYVDKDYYSKFLEEHSPDVLLGYLISGVDNISARTMDSILKSKEHYLNEWEKSLRLSNFSNTQNNIQVYRDVYAVALYDIYNKQIIPNDLTQLLSEYGNKHTEAQGVLKKILKTKNYEYIMDVEAIARDIVGLCMFARTNLYPFITTMLAYKRIFEKEKEELTADDAATYATIDWILDYLLSQISIIDSNGNVLKKPKLNFAV